MFKKLFALLICVAMIFIVSCSGETVELLDFIDASADLKLDCEGKTFSFSSSWAFEWYAFDDDELPTVAVEKMMKRFHSIKEEFNAEFEMLSRTDSELNLLLVSGKAFPELIDTTAEGIYPFYNSNVLASLNRLDAIDLNDEKWGDPTFIQYGQFDGEQYGFYAWHWEFIPQFEGATIFNAENVAKFGATHPYELQENGLWNWDTFEAELAKCTVLENDIQYYGANVSYDEISKAAIFSNGGQIIEGNQEDGYKFGVKSDKAVQALEWLQGLDDAGYFFEGTMADFSKQKSSTYLVGPSYYGTNFNPNSDAGDEYFSNNLNDYGFITFPTGPQGDESDVGAYTFRRRRLNYISDISDIEAENSAKIVNYLFEPLEGSGETGWKTYVQDLIFTTNNNQTCMDNFLFILENVAYDYSVQMTTSTYETLCTSLASAVKGSKSISEVISSVESKVMAEIGK